jgi:hypothetical protein
MFRLRKNETQLSFTHEKEEVLFGDGTRIMFWIDLELRVLQRGRQEYIPIDSISEFGVGEDGRSLVAHFDSNPMTLYEGTAEEGDKLRAAAGELNDFCGI